MWVDCDVIQADGGTRCAAITGGYVALHRALAGLVDAGACASCPPCRRSPPSPSASSTASRASTSPYVEDVRAEVDMNVVMTGDGRLVEVQGTAEAEPFSRAVLDELLVLAERGIAEIRARQLVACAAPR